MTKFQQFVRAAQLEDEELRQNTPLAVADVAKASGVGLEEGMQLAARMIEQGLAIQAKRPGLIMLEHDNIAKAWKLGRIR